LLQNSGIELKKLKKQLTDEQLSDIARKISFNWKSCAPKLDVSSTDIGDIEEDCRKVEERRHRVLQKWKQMKSFKATGKVFVEVLLTTSQANQANEVCLLLK